MKNGLQIVETLEDEIAPEGESKDKLLHFFHSFCNLSWNIIQIEIYSCLNC